MNTIARTSTFSGSKIFWLFIFLSVLAHITLLLINAPETTVQTPVAKAPLQINLHEQTQTPTIPEQLVAKATPPHTITPTKPQKPLSARAETTVIQKQPAQNVEKTQPHSGIQIRADALHWLQQQANEMVNPQPAWQQLVSLGETGQTGSYTSQYQNQSGETVVAFNTRAGVICAKARPADPLDSFDQGSWTIAANCNL